MIQEKINFYLKEKVLVHIRLKNKRFLNCKILEKKSEKIYIIKERKMGLMHLFIEDVFGIDEFVEGVK